MPIFAIGYKDNEELKENRENIVKKHIAIEILLNMAIGKSSELYKKLYENIIFYFVRHSLYKSVCEADADA